MAVVLEVELVDTAGTALLTGTGASRAKVRYLTNDAGSFFEHFYLLYRIRCTNYRYTVTSTLIFIYLLLFIYTNEERRSVQVQASASGSTLFVQYGHSGLYPLCALAYPRAHCLLQAPPPLPPIDACTCHVATGRLACLGVGQPPSPGLPSPVASMYALALTT